MSGGHTALVPPNDYTSQTKSNLLASIDASMGGRVAEEILLGKEKVTSEIYLIYLNIDV